MPTPKSPPRQTSLDTLVPAFRVKVEAVLRDLEGHGLDPIIYEARRTKERQAWLFGVGRTHSLDQRPVTWTMASRHRTGHAADIISKGKGWGDANFFKLLKSSALSHGLRDFRGDVHFDGDKAHVQMGD